MNPFTRAGALATIIVTGATQLLAQGGLLVQRPDDRPAVIVRRLQVYETDTAPLVAFYKPRGLVHTVDAGGTPETVLHDVLRAVEGLPA